MGRVLRQFSVLVVSIDSELVSRNGAPDWPSSPSLQLIELDGVVVEDAELAMLVEGAEHAEGAQRVHHLTKKRRKKMKLGCGCACLVNLWKPTAGGGGRTQHDKKR